MDFGKADRWSLADDVRLLCALEDFSGELTKSAGSVLKQIDDMTTEVYQAEISLDAINNELLLISNARFVESQVGGIEKNAAPVISGPEKPPQTPVPEDNIKEAVAYGVNFMRKAYTNVVVSDTESESSSEELDSHVWNLELRDPYVQYPLPYLIGSSQFEDDDFIGLRSAILGSSEPPQSEEELTEEEFRDFSGHSAGISPDSKKEVIVDVDRVADSEMMDRTPKRLGPSSAEALFGWSSEEDDSEALIEDSVGGNVTLQTPHGRAADFSDVLSNIRTDSAERVVPVISTPNEAGTVDSKDPYSSRQAPELSRAPPPRARAQIVFSSDDEEEDLFETNKTFVKSAVQPKFGQTKPARSVAEITAAVGTASSFRSRVGVLDSGSDEEDLFTATSSSKFTNNVSPVLPNSESGVSPLKQNNVPFEKVPACNSDIKPTKNCHGIERVKSTYEELFDSDSSDEISVEPINTSRSSVKLPQNASSFDRESRATVPESSLPAPYHSPGGSQEAGIVATDALQRSESANNRTPNNNSSLETAEDSSEVKVSSSTLLGKLQPITGNPSELSEETPTSSAILPDPSKSSMGVSNASEVVNTEDTAVTSVLRPAASGDHKRPASARLSNLAALIERQLVDASSSSGGVERRRLAGSVVAVGVTSDAGTKEHKSSTDFKQSSQNRIDRSDNSENRINADSRPCSVSDDLVNASSFSSSNRREGESAKVNVADNRLPSLTKNRVRGPSRRLPTRNSRAQNVNGASVLIGSEINVKSSPVSCEHTAEIAPQGDTESSRTSGADRQKPYPAESGDKNSDSPINTDRCDVHELSLGAKNGRSNTEEVEQISSGVAGVRTNLNSDFSAEIIHSEESLEKSKLFIDSSSADNRSSPGGSAQAASGSSENAAKISMISSRNIFDSDSDEDLFNVNTPHQFSSAASSDRTDSVSLQPPQPEVDSRSGEILTVNVDRSGKTSTSEPDMDCIDELVQPDSGRCGLESSTSSADLSRHRNAAERYQHHEANVISPLDSAGTSSDSNASRESQEEDGRISSAAVEKSDPSEKIGTVDEPPVGSCRVSPLRHVCDTDTAIRSVSDSIFSSDSDDDLFQNDNGHRARTIDDSASSQQGTSVCNTLHSMETKSNNAANDGSNELVSNTAVTNLPAPPLSGVLAEHNEDSEFSSKSSSTEIEASIFDSTAATIKNNDSSLKAPSGSSAKPSPISLFDSDSDEDLFHSGAVSNPEKNIAVGGAVSPGGASLLGRESKPANPDGIQISNQTLSSSTEKGVAKRSNTEILRQSLAVTSEHEVSSQNITTQPISSSFNRPSPIANALPVDCESDCDALFPSVAKVDLFASNPGSAGLPRLGAVSRSSTVEPSLSRARSFLDDEESELFLSKSAVRSTGQRSKLTAPSALPSTSLFSEDEEDLFGSKPTATVSPMARNVSAAAADGKNTARSQPRSSITEQANIPPLSRVSRPADNAPLSRKMAAHDPLSDIFTD